MNKHVASENVYQIFEYFCKYCGCDLVYDPIEKEFIAYIMFNECISDEEKIIKDLLE